MAEPSPQRVEELFDRALDLAPAQRPSFLDEQCAGDTDLRAAVAELLELDRRAEETDSTLGSPVAVPRRTDPGPRMPTVARYRVLRVLGEGGMGTVYEAEQDNPRRTVALKVLRAGFESDSWVKRFAREAQILGRLRHPGIAQVYDAGVAESGQPYFVMELVAGVPLDQYAHDRGLDTAGRLELVARVCDAVQHAHDRGVIHRDLKPSNVLVDDTGQPKVLDFGVARAADADQVAADRTQTGLLVGTPSYMSPEQFAGDSTALDRRSDVYTLGVILYELLAGRLPYPLNGLPLPEMARVIRERAPLRLGPLFRGDVEMIVAKALDKDPGRRYPTAADLAADIRRHLAHEPILARAPSALYQLGKFARRHKVLVGTSAAFLSVLLAAAGLTAWQAVRLAEAERDEAVRQAQSERDQAQRNQDVQTAMARAAVRREQARRTPGDQVRWAEALSEAGRARALVESGPVAPGLAERVAGLQSEMDEEHTDRRLAARLADIRLLAVEIDPAKNRFIGGQARGEYQTAFEGYGLRPSSTDPAAAAALILRRPAEVREPVVTGLGSWLTLAHHERAPEAGWLVRVLDAVDPDDWRRRLRAAFGAQDLRAVEALAAEADVTVQPPGALEAVAQVLQANKKVEPAVRLMRRAREAYPGNFWINHTLGMALGATTPPQPDEAIRFLTAAVALQPECAGAWHNLGSAFLEHDRVDEAILAYRKAVGLKPAYAAAHVGLGLALERNGRLAESVAAFREATRTQPDYKRAHSNLGHFLRRRGDRAGAVAAFRAALAIDPDWAEAHDGLGLTLFGQGDLPAAVTRFERAVRSDETFADAHCHLGNALSRLGDHPGAVACYRKAIADNPEMAEAYCNLGNQLMLDGDLPGALGAIKTGHELGSRRKDWHIPTPRRIYACERFIEMANRLPGLLAERPDDDDLVPRALLCGFKKLFASAARYYAAAFEADPRLADDRHEEFRFRAACSAAQAGCGEGADATTIPEKARASLRKQALEWLRADLAAWVRLHDRGTPQEHAMIRAALHVWHRHPALAGVRDSGKIGPTLSPDERMAWQQFWAAAAALAAKVRLPE